MKVLVIRFSSIGDIVLTTPVIRALRHQVPDVQVHVLTKLQFHQVLEANPYIHKIHLLHNSWEQLLHELKLEEFDYIIDLHHNLRTARLKRELKVPATSFNKLNVQKWLYTNFKINMLPPVHIVDRYFETVRHLGVQNDHKGLDYFIPEGKGVSFTDLPYAHAAGYIGVVVGAAHATKCLPVDKLQELCALIQHPLVLLGGPGDAATGAAVAAVDPIKIYNACGKFSLHESADLVRKAKLVITHDTGLMHIAAAFKKPILSIWGNTVPAFGMTPYYGNNPVPSQIFEVQGLRCRPCSKIGYNQCPRKHFRCMRRQDLQQIARTAEAWARQFR
ncbi:MAG: glycosyltransferase family 9 protein [Lacibacter sp.]